LLGFVFGGLVTGLASLHTAILHTAILARVSFVEQGVEGPSRLAALFGQLPAGLRGRQPAADERL
jgi:hypothetical protein